MPKYWLSCLSWENFLVNQENDFALSGYRERELKRVLRIEPGDLLVHYIKRLGLLGAIGEARRRVYIAWTPIWQDDTYPCRLEHRPLLVLSRGQMVEVGLVLPRLSLAPRATPPRLAPRATPPRLALRCDLYPIPQEDFQIIEQEMRRRAEGSA